MSLLVALQLSGKRCLVLGQSAEAARRTSDLLSAGAVVTVLAPCPGPELEQLGSSARVTLERRAWHADDLEGAWLVVLADREPELLARLGPSCTARRILFCAVDQPGHNGFHHVAVARAGSVSLAVSTDGRAPALAKRLRDELQRALERADVAGLAEELSHLRATADPEARKHLLGAAAARLRVSIEVD